MVVARKCALDCVFVYVKCLEYAVQETEQSAHCGAGYNVLLSIRILVGHNTSPALIDFFVVVVVDARMWTLWTSKQSRRSTNSVCWCLRLRNVRIYVCG